MECGIVVVVYGLRSVVWSGMERGREEEEQEEEEEKEEEKEKEEE